MAFDSMAAAAASDSMAAAAAVFVAGFLSFACPWDNCLLVLATAAAAAAASG